MKSYLIGMIIVAAVLAGCTGSQQAESCTGKSVLDVNGALSVCTDGKMVSTCTGEGGIYSESATEKVVCKGGKWVKEAVTVPTQPSNETPSGQPLATNNSSTEANPAGETEQNCSGKTWVSINDVTKACVNGKMTTLCSEEGQVYKESLTIHKKVVCEGGKWIVVPIPNDDSEGSATGCTGKSTATVNGVTNVCINGTWTTKCTADGEVYSRYEPLQTEVVCESGAWISRDIE